MDYRRFVQSSNVQFKINDHLIECGTTTWQIRNIAATSVSKSIVPFREPEPRFTWDEPKIAFSFKASFGVTFIVWIMVTIFTGSPNGGIFAAMVTFGLFIYMALAKLSTKKDEWNAEKARIEKKWKIWDTMRRNPPVLYSLMLETNAGSKPLFYSFDEAQIIKSNEAVKRSMAKKEMGDIKFEIETVNMGGADSINNFGSEIYNQSIQGC